MNTLPVKLYMQAREQVKTDRDGAVASIRQALNVTTPTPTLDRTIEKALDPNTLLGDGLLQLVMHEATK